MENIIALIGRWVDRLLVLSELSFKSDVKLSDVKVQPPLWSKHLKLCFLHCLLVLSFSDHWDYNWLNKDQSCVL